MLLPFSLGAFIGIGVSAPLGLQARQGRHVRRRRAAGRRRRLARRRSSPPGATRSAAGNGPAADAAGRHRARPAGRTADRHRPGDGDADDAGAASGTYSTFQQLGAALGMAVIGFVFFEPRRRRLHSVGVAFRVRYGGLVGGRRLPACAPPRPCSCPTATRFRSTRASRPSCWRARRSDAGPGTSARQVAPRARELAPGADRGDLAVDQDDDPVGLLEGGALGGGADHGGAALAQGDPQLDLGGRRRGRWRRRRPAAARSRRPAPAPGRAAGPGRRTAARRGDPRSRRGRRRRRGRARAGRRRRRRGSARSCPRSTLSAKVPDSTRGTWATWATWPGRRNVSASSISWPFQRIEPVCPTRPASADEQAGLARADLTEQQHQLAGAHVEVDAHDAARAVVVHGRDVAEAELDQRTCGGASRGRRGGACDEVDAAAAAYTRSTPPASLLEACCHARTPGASVTTAPATRPNQSKPLTAPATRIAVARSQPPRKYVAQAATTPACTITTGTPSSTACTRCSKTAASTRPWSTLRRCRVDRRGRRGELDGAGRLERRDQRPAEAGAGGRRLGRRAAGDRPTDATRPCAEPIMTASSTPPASRLPPART